MANPLQTDNTNLDRDLEVNSPLGTGTDTISGSTPGGDQTLNQETMRNRVGDLKEGAGKVVRRFRDQASQVAGRVKDSTSSAAQNVASTVRENPVNSVLVSFAVGCLVGVGITALLMSMSRSNLDMNYEPRTATL